MDSNMRAIVVVLIVSFSLTSASAAGNGSMKDEECRAEVESLRATTYALVATVEELTNRVEAAERWRTDITAASSQRGKRQLALAADTVAFTAYVDHNVQHMGLNQVIPFNTVVTNIGSGFNVNTFTFTCPVSGLYLFTFVVSEIGDTELVAKLVIDNKNVVDAIANPVRGDHDQQGGNTAVVKVNRGQSVWVVNYYRNNVYLRTDENYRFASFSGVLLQSTE